MGMAAGLVRGVVSADGHAPVREDEAARRRQAQAENAAEAAASGPAVGYLLGVLDQALADQGTQVVVVAAGCFQCSDLDRELPFGAMELAGAVVRFQELVEGKPHRWGQVNAGQGAGG